MHHLVRSKLLASVEAHTEPFLHLQGDIMAYLHGNINQTLIERKESSEDCSLLGCNSECSDGTLSSFRNNLLVLS